MNERSTGNRPRTFQQVSPTVRDRTGEERLRMVLLAARMGTWTWNVTTDDHHRDANLNKLLGLPAKETVLPLDHFFELMHLDDRGIVRTAFEQSAHQGRPLNVEFRVVWPDGSVRWIHDQGGVVSTASQVRMVGACADVTELKEIEASLLASEVQSRTQADSVPDLLWQFDPKTGSGWVNRRWIDYTGMADYVVYPWGWHEAVHPDDLNKFRAAFDQGIASGKPFRLEHRLRRATDGGYRWFMVGAAPLRDDSDRIVSWFGAVTDVHDQREARNELVIRVAERMAILIDALKSLEHERERQSDLARRLSTAEEGERQQMACDLHDSATQHLAGLSSALKKAELANNFPLSWLAE